MGSVIAEGERQESDDFHKKLSKTLEKRKGLGDMEISVQKYGGEVVGEVEENRVKQRTAKKRKEEETSEEKLGVIGIKLQDPLVVLGLDIMNMILSCLDARIVALCLPVSHGWHGVACSDLLWSPKCKELWHGKAHIPRTARLPGMPKLAAYSLSILDSKRVRIMRDDLCGHAWDFHFSEAAPEYWRKLDPYREGTGLPMRRYFHPDGSQTAGPGDKVWGGHEACYCTVTSLEANDKIRKHYVRINRSPALSISRTRDWGWEMSNKFVRYCSLPDYKA